MKHHHYFHLRELTARLALSTDDLVAAIRSSSHADVPTPRKRVITMAVPAVLADLDAEVTRATTVQAGAAALIRGIAARIDAAVQLALGNGATAEELAPITAEVATLKTATDDLTAAVSEGTPAAPVA